MGAVTGFLNSEKGLLGLALIVAATVLTAIGKMTTEQWLYFTGAIYGLYATTKTVQGALAARKEGAANENEVPDPLSKAKSSSSGAA